MTRTSNEYYTNIALISQPEDARRVIRTLARYGRITRLSLLKRLYGHMMSFDLDRVLPGLKGQVKTEVVDGVTYYSLR